MQRQRIFALVIGLLMVTSAAGYAYSGLSITGAATQQPAEPEPIPTIAGRFLTSQEGAAILGSGRVLIQSVYHKECGECRLTDLELRNFATRYAGFVFLESVETSYGSGFEKLQMVGSSGRIIDLKGEEITQQRLLELYGTIAVVKPRDLVAQDYLSQLANRSQPSAINGS